MVRMPKIAVAMVYSRANFKCELCGSRNGRLEIHHKDKNRKNNSPENLILLCSKCHAKLDGRGCKKHSEKTKAIIAEKVYAAWRDPIKRAHMLEALKRIHVNPERNKKVSIARIEYFQKHPEKRKEIGDRLRIVSLRRWGDPIERERILKAQKGRISGT
jgi:hypothetical protein